MGHKQLTFEQRYHISAFWRAGNSQTAIAKEIGVHRSTISRELRRNTSVSGLYKLNYAQTFTEERHKFKRKYFKFTKEIASYIEEKILLQWSPE